jgi:hypothetical protein
LMVSSHLIHVGFELRDYSLIPASLRRTCNSTLYVDPSRLKNGEKYIKNGLERIADVEGPRPCHRSGQHNEATLAASSDRSH